jgi:hypothetical protein
MQPLKIVNPCQPFPPDRRIPMKSSASFALASLALALAACGGSKPAPAPANAGVPAWFADVPQQPGFVFGVASSDGVDLNLAKQDADVRACSDVTRQLGQKIEGIFKDWQKQAGTKTDKVYQELMENTQRSVIGMDITGCSTEKREIKEMGTTGFRVYALAKLNPEQAAAVAQKSLEAAKARMAASAATKEADDAFAELTKTLQELGKR